jgi:hypothetical protein
MINRKSRDKTVMAAKNRKEPMAARIKAAIPKKRTELAGVRKR